MHAEMPRAASLLQGSFSVRSKVPNGSATESGTATPSDTCGCQETLSHRALQAS